NEFLLAPLASLEALARTRPDLGRWDEATAASAQRAVYAFVVAGEGRVRARMFAPGLAGGEDPATGSAAGPLGAYAARYLGLDRLSIVQGVEMGRPSLLHVDASGPRPRVGGASVIVAGGELRLPT
ncbi:MAG TPA: PhzF family phenazine biosynthesis protein, partial [Candidatus Dormibacteraeota bacterium]|nr:PhzF family phenazine biosynthesis protein [Candidatus Dormibacteraeota bacterium]